MSILSKTAALIPFADLMGTAGGVNERSAPGTRKWPALDGLRGTAILLVLTCHYSSLLPQSNPLVGVLANGWAGVDLFFVLSGFLINGILFDAKGSPQYFRNFYARRTLRIFPLYFGFLFTIVLILLVLKLAPWQVLQSVRSNSTEDIQRLWDYQPWLWTYTANFKLAFEKEWGLWVDCIVPLWSLSIEEQFYLVWPLVVFYFSQRALIRICLGIIVGALLVRLILTATGTSFFAIYTLTFTRADSLAAGALLALLIRLPDGEQLARKLAKYAGVIAGLLVLVGCRGFDPRHPYLRDLLYSSLAILCAAFVFWSIDPASLRGIPDRFYRSRVLRTIGGYSYGMYVFHQPLMNLTTSVLARWGIFDPARESWSAALMLVAVNAALSFSLAFISFHLYEKQFLKLKRYFPEGNAKSQPVAAAAR